MITLTTIDADTVEVSVGSRSNVLVTVNVPTNAGSVITLSHRDAVVVSTAREVVWLQILKINIKVSIRVGSIQSERRVSTRLQRIYSALQISLPSRLILNTIFGK